MIHNKREILIISSRLKASKYFHVTRITDGITNCILIKCSINNQEIRQIGIAVKSPNDKANDLLGYKIAYGRALKKMAIRILNDKGRWGIE